MRKENQLHAMANAALGQAPLFTRPIRWSSNLVYDMPVIYLPLSENRHTATSVLASSVYGFSRVAAG